MPRRIFPSGDLFKAGARSNINLASDYRLYSLLTASLEKRNRAVHCSVIGYGDRSVSRRRRRFGNFFNAAGAVKQTVFTVQVKMHEVRHTDSRLSILLIFRYLTFHFSSISA